MKFDSSNLISILFGTFQLKLKLFIFSNYTFQLASQSFKTKPVQLFNTVCALVDNVLASSVNTNPVISRPDSSKGGSRTIPTPCLLIGGRRSVNIVSSKLIRSPAEIKKYIMIHKLWCILYAAFNITELLVKQCFHHCHMLLTPSHVENVILSFTY